MRPVLVYLVTCLALGPVILRAAGDPVFAELASRYQREVLPVMEGHCWECHDEASLKGDLDLERFTEMEAVRRHPAVWQEVQRQVNSGEMPPEKGEPLSAEEKTRLLGWIADYLRAEALAHAGDPGPVVLRRLSNVEYTHTVRDLTGVETLEPAAEFPVDSAAGEGFTNTGAAQAMSPALFEKYLQSAKDIAGHAVLLPEGFRFSHQTSRRDWADELVEAIRAVYLQALHAEDLDFAYRSEVGAAAPEGASEGRLDLIPYMRALLAGRREAGQGPESAGSAGSSAANGRLNARYLQTLADTLEAVSGDGGVLLEAWRRRWETVSPDDAGARELAAWVRSWQDRLWTFNRVGHLGGYTLDWQEPIDPVTGKRVLALPVVEDAPGGADDDEALFSLVAGSAGDGGHRDEVLWESPRLLRTGRTPVPLRAAPAVARAFLHLREAALAKTERVLAALFDLRTGTAEVAELASEHGLEVDDLTRFLGALGMGTWGAPVIETPLTLPKEAVNGYAEITGWGLEGQQHLSLLGNAGESTRYIPGEVPPHAIVVHPMPDLWVGATWQAPIEGRVKVEVRVQDRHACGNGVLWILEHTREGRRTVLGEGAVQTSGAELAVQVEIDRHDLLTLRIDPRDRDHTCDLTEIELAITAEEEGGARWSLQEDCAGDLLAGNPHPDRMGNQGVWHFHAGEGVSSATAAEVMVPGSLPARWLATEDVEEAGILAREMAEHLRGTAGSPSPALEQVWVSAWRRADGPLFAGVDLGALEVGDGPLTPADAADAGPWGVARERFTPEGHLLSDAPEVLTFSLPREVFAGYELVVEAGLGASIGENASAEGGTVQLDLVRGRASAPEDLVAALPVTAMSGSASEQRMRRDFDRFRQLFPAAMCYSRVVPIDEVVTLVLYHREDDHLARLMLDPEERERLDVLWEELMFVSEDALRMSVALEQILEFATQDADPAKFAPMVEPVAAKVKALREARVTAEPTHLQALRAFADRAYRRPLTEDEARDLTLFYDRLRSQEALGHEEAFRLTLARVLASPTFLYRMEQPGEGESPAPVSPWELATRLSYFLTSSTPDAALMAAARTGALQTPEGLLEQTKRLLAGDGSRRLAEDFACQWLQIRDFHVFDEKNERLYPEFVSLRVSMYEEAVRFFTDLWQQDGSILDILEADYTFADEALAAFYEFPGDRDASSDWERIEGVRAAGRGGILGMAAVLAKHSGVSRTSPILRGNWVSEVLLGERLPRPPADVPPLPEGVPEGLSERQMIERHSADPACAKCHVRIDPLGFALEGFDTVGHRREIRAGDTRTQLADGTPLDGFEGLRRYVARDRRQAFVGQFCRKLLGYALGRAVQLSDEPFLEEMSQRLSQEDYRVWTAVTMIVQSPQFQKIRGRDWRGPVSHEGDEGHEGEEVQETLP